METCNTKIVSDAWNQLNGLVKQRDALMEKLSRSMEIVALWPDAFSHHGKVQCYITGFCLADVSNAHFGIKQVKPEGETKLWPVSEVPWSLVEDTLVKAFSSKMSAAELAEVRGRLKKLCS